MIILDPDGMPVNLGHSGREDYPEQLFPVIAYDGENVIPTALGYRSFFREDNKFNVGTLLADKLVQQIFVFQTVAMSSIYLALCEDGLYVSNATDEASQFPWLRIVDTSVGQVEGVRRVWTYCVISNVVYFYQQGADGFWGLVNPAQYAETTIPTGITGASKLQIWLNENLQVGLLKYLPNFLNMAGQLGIFKAGNRLGFWDSENAVAWSSATQVYDFKPSVTNFAGLTTFTDVVGNITTIKQHGNGFLIYATKSITLVLPLSGSPEKWSGRAIFSDVGVIFDIQVAVGQPDTIHFAVTSGGLVRIENGAPEFIQPEVMDYVRQNNELYALTLVESRYLFIQAANELGQSSAPVLDVVRIDDGAGNSYYFPKPVEIVKSDLAGQVIDQINSKDPNFQLEFAAAMEPIEGETIAVPSDRALVPCWTGYTLATNFEEDVITAPANELEIMVPSGVTDEVEWPCAVTIAKPRYSNYYYGADGVDGIRFIDKAGEEYTQLLADAFQQLIQVRDITLSGSVRFRTMENLQLPTVEEAVKELTQPANVGPGVHTTTVDVDQLTWTWNNVIDYTNPLTAEGNECALDIILTNSDIEFKGTANITETLEGYYYVKAVLGATAYTIGDSGFLESPIPVSAEPFLRLYEEFPQPWVSSVGIMTCSEELTACAKIFFGNDGIGVGPTNNFRVFLYAENTGNSTIVGQAINGSFPSGLNPNDGQGNSIVARNTAGMSKTSTSLWGLMSVQAARALGNDGGALQYKEFILNAGVSDASDLVWSASTPPSTWQYIWPSIGFVSSLPKQLAWQAFDLTRDSSGAGATTIAYKGNFSAMHLSPESAQGTAISTFNKPINPNWEALLDEGVNNIPVSQVTLNSIELVITPTITPKAVGSRDKGFSAEVSGYGYIPRGGFSFRKTHSRSLFKACGPTRSPIFTGPLEDVEDGLNNGIFNPALPTTPNPTLYPPYQWDYPDRIPLPDNYVMFQKGSLSPYYPTYVEALVLDLQLEKWGKYSNPHKHVYSLFPVNRTDQSIVPVKDYGMRAGALNTIGQLSMFATDNPDSKITYGKIGDYRKGNSLMSIVVADFAKPSNCYVIVEASLNGDYIDPMFSEANTVVNSLRVEMPFTAVAKWFNIRLEGAFDLKGLAFESSSKGRR